MKNPIIVLLFGAATFGCDSDCEAERDRLVDIIEQSKSCEVDADCGFVSGGCLGTREAITFEARDSAEYIDAEEAYDACMGGCYPEQAGRAGSNPACVDGMCVEVDDTGT